MNFTNLQAKLHIESIDKRSKEIDKKEHKLKWKSTSLAEFKSYVGILLLMGMVRMLRIDDY